MKCVLCCTLSHTFYKISSKVKPLVIHFSVEMQLSVMVDIFEFMDYYQLLLNKPNTGNPSNLKKTPKK